MVETPIRKEYLDRYWKEYPLIQKESFLLKGDHLSLYQEIRLNPTKDLQALCKRSGLKDHEFFDVIEELCRKAYLRILSVYFSIDHSERYVERLFFKHQEIKAKARTS